MSTKFEETLLVSRVAAKTRAYPGISLKKMNVLNSRLKIVFERQLKYSEVWQLEHDFSNKEAQYEKHSKDNKNKSLDWVPKILHESVCPWTLFSLMKSRSFFLVSLSRKLFFSENRYMSRPRANFKAKWRLFFTYFFIPKKKTKESKPPSIETKYKPS